MRPDADFYSRAVTIAKFLHNTPPDTDNMRGDMMHGDPNVGVWGRPTSQLK